MIASLSYHPEGILVVLAALIYFPKVEAPHEHPNPSAQKQLLRYPVEQAVSEFSVLAESLVCHLLLTLYPVIRLKTKE